MTKISFSNIFPGEISNSYLLLEKTDIIKNKGGYLYNEKKDFLNKIKWYEFCNSAIKEYLVHDKDYLMVS